MLTRLKVTGFKNLVDVDVRLGPFTCIAGANGVGKSNLFDAIRFLSALADRPFIDAALSVRAEGERNADIRSLFHRVGNVYASEMSFEAEMIVPKRGSDDLGQNAEASITFLRYSITLAYRVDINSSRSLGLLELLKEELVHINVGDAVNHLLFPHKLAWRQSAVKGRRTSSFISTEEKDKKKIIKLHQDGGGGRTLSLMASSLPRTVISNANAVENRTALLARTEMQSWRLLQLEPSSLRRPDEFSAPTRLGADGSHLPSTLYRLAHSGNRNETSEEARDVTEDQTYGQVANRLAELIDDVRGVWIHRDEQRELLSLQVKGRDGTSHSARALSDGTLRFLALAVLELDPEAQGLLCLEEPENGIHPERIPAMLKLLQDLATDVSESAGTDNPLRQVIINTHSPSVVGQVPDDSLLVAELKETVQSGKQFKRVCFSCLPGTWRERAAEKASVIPRGQLLAYLNPIPSLHKEGEIVPNGNAKTHHQSNRRLSQSRRVVDRPDFQHLIPGLPSSNDE